MGMLPISMGIAVAQQAIELRAVAGELGAFVEDLAERLLHGVYLGADRQLAAELLLQIGRGGEMVCMRVRLEQPVDGEALVAHIRDDRVGRSGGGASGRLIEVEDRVDDCCPEKSRDRTRHSLR